MNDFNDRLLSLIEHERERIKSQYGTKNIEFIEELAKQFRKEWAEELTKQKTNQEEDRCERVKEIHNYALDSLENCLNYAYLIYFTDILYNCENPEWVSDYLKRASEKYHQSGFLKFLYGLAVTEELAMAKVALPEIMDPVELIADSSHMDYESVIEAQKKFLSIIIDFRKEHRELLKHEYKLLGVPEPTLESYIESYIDFKISLFQTILANYYWLVDEKEKSKKCLECALKLYNNNSNAIMQQAYLMIDENPSKAINEFKKVFKSLAKDQFPKGLMRTYAEIGGNSGQGLSYFEMGLYEKAEECHNKALEIQEQKLKFSELVKVTLQLDINRSRIERENFTNAMEDLREIKRDLTAKLEKDTRNERLWLRDKLAEVHNLLGLIYLKHGIYENAEPFFLKAMELNPKSAQSYHYFGILQYEKGNRERAKKLFKASVGINPNYKTGIEALRKLEESEIAGLCDWCKWWFEDEVSPKKMRLRDRIKHFIKSPKKIIGGLLVVLLISLILFLSYSIAKGSGIFSASNTAVSVHAGSLFGILAIIIVVLMLPFIKKVEAGPVKFETASTGETHPRF
jgi:tetratricopeptide (TPR) repeat protein